MRSFAEAPRLRGVTPLLSGMSGSKPRSSSSFTRSTRQSLTAKRTASSRFHRDVESRAALVVAQKRGLLVRNVFEKGSQTLAVVSLNGVEKGLRVAIHDLGVVDVHHQRKAQVHRRFLRQRANAQARSVIDQILHRAAVLAQTGPVQRRATEEILVVHIKTSLHQSLDDICQLHADCIATRGVALTRDVETRHPMQITKVLRMGVHEAVLQFILVAVGNGVKKVLRVIVDKKTHNHLTRSKLNPLCSTLLLIVNRHVVSTSLILQVKSICEGYKCLKSDVSSTANEDLDTLGKTVARCPVNKREAPRVKCIKITLRRAESFFQFLCVPLRLNHALYNFLLN